MPGSCLRSLKARGDRGAVTAEFVAAMPAVILVLGLCLAASHLASTQLRVQDAASSAARSASRGEGAGAIAERVRQLVPGASVSSSERDGLVCSTVVLPAVLPGPASAVTLRASACALAEFG